MRISSISLALLSLLAFAWVSVASVQAAPHTSEGHWLEDYDEGVRIAREQGKDLLVDFTGSDWCGWCIRLDSEVFEHAEWLEAAKRDFVLVKLDFPKAQAIKDKVPNPKRNEELKARLGVTGFPSILMVTAEGEVFGRTGYKKGGPGFYIEHMAELRAKGLKQLEAVIDLVKAYNQATGKERSACWEAVASHIFINGIEGPGAMTCLDLIKGVITAPSPETKEYIPRAFEVLGKVGAVDLSVAQAAFVLDPKNAEGIFEGILFALLNGRLSEDQVGPATTLIKAYKELGVMDDVEQGFFVFLMGAHWSMNIHGDLAEAKVYAKKALALDAGRDDMRGFLEQIMAKEDAPAEDGGSSK